MAMTHSEPSTARRAPTWVTVATLFAVAVGGGVFIMGMTMGTAGKAWQAYLINFLLFAAIAHGAVLFSTLMHTVNATWSGSLADLAEAFSAFFPVSFLLFLFLYWGQDHVFPWLHHDLHGKEVWLNLPFLFSRDAVGLLILYGCGFGYLYHALYFKVRARGATGKAAVALSRRWQKRPPDEERFRRRMSVFAILYMLAFAVVLSLLGYDLTMSADPHWYSTLFGAYCFIKSVYVGFGALIILAALLHLSPRNDFALKASQFHDIGKLFFAFGLMWADFFYAQLVVIWYGNISEETSYVIQRTMLAPWNAMAWTVFGVCFIIPFVILLNRKIKTMPRAMILLCSAAIAGMWIEHFLLLRPAYTHGEPVAPLYFSDVLIMFGFLGLMASAVAFYLNTFPGITAMRSKEVA